MPESACGVMKARRAISAWFKPRSLKWLRRRSPTCTVEAAALALEVPVLTLFLATVQSFKGACFLPLFLLRSCIGLIHELFIRNPIKLIS